MPLLPILLFGYLVVGGVYFLFFSRKAKERRAMLGAPRRPAAEIDGEVARVCGTARAHGDLLVAPSGLVRPAAN